ncbi:porin [Ectothiorhodospiraceae bacterium WFHF3C12]|nr:porin [Ectothiorhodospiraceae bacterium WFHF3C12]
MKTLNRSALALVLAAATLPAQAEIELAGDALRVYGKVHMSLDYLDSDVSESEYNSPRPAYGDKYADNTFSVSSNSSRIGFRGLYPVNDTWNATYQLEQGYNLDSGDGEWATRNSYLGLQADWFGEVRVGHHDTPFKDVGGMIDELGDTIGDRRAIIGAGAAIGNTMNARVENMILYRRGIPLGDSELQVSGLYSTDAGGNSGSPDDNNDRVASVGAMWGLGPLTLGAALEDWTDIRGGGDARGARVGAEVTFGNFIAGVLLESIHATGAARSLDREAFGLKLAYDDNVNKLVAQLHAADEYDDVDDSAAYMTSLAAFRKLGGGLSGYAALTRTANDDNAAYQGVDGGHGDELGTGFGGSPVAVSVGAVLSF